MDTNGSITVLGVAVTLTPDTEFDDVESCAVIMPGAHVEVEIADDTSAGLVAEEVELEDADGDGCHDHEDDSNDGGEEEDAS